VARGGEGTREKEKGVTREGRAGHLAGALGSQEREEKSPIVGKKSYPGLAPPKWGKMS